ncbi:MAG: hypothetical protein ACHREM_01555 [Polyangiales bacterium]
MAPTSLPDPRAALARLADQLGDDECRVLVYLAERLSEGARVYGRMDLANDRRDFARERAEELADALVYTAMGEVQRVVTGTREP